MKVKASMQKSEKIFSFASSSNVLGFKENHQAHIYGKNIIKKNNQNSCQLLKYSDHQVPGAILNLMLLSSKLTTPSVKFKVEIFMEEIEPALMERRSFDIERKQSHWHFLL